MTRLIVILLIVFLLLTILRTIIRYFRLPPSQIKSKPGPNINKEKNSKKDDDIIDAKFEELK